MARIDLRKQFQEEIDSLVPWNSKEEWLEENTVLTENCSGYLERLLYLGGVLSIMPSGKLYTFWTTNQSCRDVIQDTVFTEMLEEKVESIGLYITYGPGADDDIWVGQALTEDYVAFCEKEKGFIYLGSIIAQNANQLEDWMDQNNYYPLVTRINEIGSIFLYDDWKQA